MAPQDPFQLLHWNMVNAHRTFKIGYDNILAKLAEPPLNDLDNFLGYCEAYTMCIEAHHTSEEKVVFPFLNKKMDFSGEAESHKLIHASLDDLASHIRSVKADHDKFDAAVLKKKMEELKSVLYEHLDEEVEHILPAKIKEAGFEGKELVDMNNQLEAYAKSVGNPFIEVPFMVSHVPPDNKEDWPGFPWLLRKVLIPYVFSRRYSGYWKYSPYAMS